MTTSTAVTFGLSHLFNSDLFDTTAYDGSSAHLDTAEHFLYKVIQVPYYEIRIDVMLLREEFEHAMSQIDQSLNTLQECMKGMS